jgi:hypothetical protein
MSGLIAVSGEPPFFLLQFSGLDEADKAAEPLSSGKHTDIPFHSRHGQNRKGSDAIMMLELKRTHDDQCTPGELEIKDGGDGCRGNGSKTDVTIYLLDVTSRLWSGLF